MGDLKKILRARLSRRSDQIAILWELVEQGRASVVCKKWIYMVDHAALSARIPEILRALDNLQEIYRPGCSKEEESSALRQLAEEGQVLYETLMTSARTPTQARAFREWFESTVANAMPGEYTISFLLGNVRPLIPWGLTFTPRRGRDLDQLENAYEDYLDFWCLRHNVSCYPDRHHHPDSEVAPIKGDFKLTMMIERNHRLWRVSTDALGFDELPKNKEVLADSMRERRHWNHIMYFALAETSGFMSFGKERLFPEELSDILQKLKGGVKGFAFVDREAIIRGDRDEDWIATFLGGQWGGLIATEVNISNPHLHGYGLLVLSRLLAAEKPASKTIPELRYDFWPWSLLYGVYCNAEHLYLKPKPEFAKDIVDMGRQLFPELRHTLGQDLEA